MKVEYPCFTYNNEVFIIIPGSRFSMNELKTRLKIMGIEDTNNLNKSNIINLYESSLRNNQNKLKILPQLRKDTDNMNSKLAISQRQSLPSNIISTNISQHKVMNISYEVNPFNTREQQINIVKPMHTNKGQYSQNPFISSNINQNKSINTFNYEFSSNQSNNNNNSNNINLDSTYNFNNTNSNNNYSYTSYQEIYHKKNNDNSIISNNNNNIIFNQKVEEQINRENNNNRNIPNVMRNNINKNSNLSINNMILSKQYEEDINNNLLNTNNNNINITNNNSKSFTYQTNKDMNNMNNNYNNDINDNNRKTYTNISDQTQYIQLKQRLPSDEISDNDGNNNNPYKNIFNNNNNQNNNNDINNKNYNYNQEISIETQRKTLVNNDDNNVVNNNNRQREQDEVSTFTFFSTFSNIKNYQFYKNRKFICLHTIILLLILCFTIAILQLITYSWDSIIDFISSFLELLVDPVRLIEVIASFFSSIFFGAINYFYITIPLLIFSFIGYIRLKKYLFKKEIKELLNKIIKDLNNNNISNENRAISEDNIYEKYLKNNGVSYREFVKKYIPAMRKMRRNEPRLNLSSMRNNDKEIVFWELSDN